MNAALSFEPYRNNNTNIMHIEIYFCYSLYLLYFNVDNYLHKINTILLAGLRIRQVHTLHRSKELPHTHTKECITLNCSGEVRALAGVEYPFFAITTKSAMIVTLKTICVTNKSFFLSNRNIT